MSNGAIRNWASIAFCLIGLGLYLMGRVDQRRRDLMKIKELRSLLSEYRELSSLILGKHE